MNSRPSRWLVPAFIGVVIVMVVAAFAAWMIDRIAVAVADIIHYQESVPVRDAREARRHARWIGRQWEADSVKLVIERADGSGWVEYLDID